VVVSTTGDCGLVLGQHLGNENCLIGRVVGGWMGSGKRASGMQHQKLRVWKRFTGRTTPG
jgi:hypothetical protein